MIAPHCQLRQLSYAITLLGAELLIMVRTLNVREIGTVTSIKNN